MKKAKLFLNGKSQAVRLPKEFRFEGTEVFIQRVGPGVMLFPIDDPWYWIERAQGLVTADFMESRDQGDPSLDDEASFK